MAGFIFYFLYKLLERNSANMLVNFAVLGLALLTITIHMSGRPVMFTVAFFTLEVFILSRFVESRGKLIWLIPPVAVLWTNAHPGFAVAPLVILAFLPLVRGARDRWNLAACLAATVVAVMFNPYGWRMYLMPLEIVRSLPLLRGLTEWGGVSTWQTIVWGGFVALVICGLSLRRQPISMILLVLLAALAAGVSNRNMPLFGVIAVFALGRTLLPALLPALRRISLIRRSDVRFETVGGWFWAIAIPLLLVGAVRLRVTPIDLGFDLSDYPRAAVRYIESRDCPDNVFVREKWSGYLLWAMPDRKLFFDGKGGFSREAARAHSEFVRIKTGWRGAVDRYDVSTFLLERGSPLAVVLSEAPDWRRVYLDSMAEVFVRAPHEEERVPRHAPTPRDSETSHAGNQEPAPGSPGIPAEAEAVSEVSIADDFFQNDARQIPLSADRRSMPGLTSTEAGSHSTGDVRWGWRNND
ncbi:MAG: hypothetical protein JSU73_05735 [candidate division WOR-3 bacterium]|nr:MAG: hypothetical protein JSU73_05735 [candidate division WOR-3 bacterium]